MARAKRLSADERKLTIIDAATRLFAARGLHGVSVNDIVDDVGVSPAVLYQHFESKEALYKAVLYQSACQREDYLRAVPIADGSLEEILRAMTRVFVRNMSRHPDILKMEMHSLLDGSRANRRYFDNKWKSFSNVIEFMIQEQSEAGGLNVANPRIASLMFQGMVREALIAKCLEDVDHFPGLAADQLVDDLVSLFMSAIGWPEENKGG